MAITLCVSEIEGLHNELDVAILNSEYNIIKSTLESDGRPGEITEHDSKQKCRVCGCDWFHACSGFLLGRRRFM
jgi:hypothetical protein